MDVDQALLDRLDTIRAVRFDHDPAEGLAGLTVELDVTVFQRERPVTLRFRGVQRFQLPRISGAGRPQTGEVFITDVSDEGLELVRIRLSDELGPFFVEALGVELLD